MPKAKFEFPAVQTKTVSENTKKIYRTRLNKLVPFGIKTIQDIMAKPHETVNAINQLIPSNEGSEDHKRDSSCRCSQCKSREERRFFLTAIFYALADTTYTKTKNPLYDAFQVNKQNYNSH